MKFFKHNFTIILLIVSSIGMGILALATALRLRETRSITPQDTQALTPSCSISFSLRDTTPRLASGPSPSPTISSLISTTPTTSQSLTTPSPTRVITATPQATQTPTPKPSTGSLQSPTQTLLAQNLTLTPTASTPTTSLTPTPTLEDAAPPQIPVSGAYLPTISILITGSALLASGLLKNKRKIN